MTEDTMLIFNEGVEAFNQGNIITPYSEFMEQRGGVWHFGWMEAAGATSPENTRALIVDLMNRVKSLEGVIEMLGRQIDKLQAKAGEEGNGG